MSNQHVFDELTEAMQFAGAEGGDWSLHVQTPKGAKGTYLMMSAFHGECGLSATVYHIPSPDGFVIELCEKLNVHDLDVYADEVHEAVWELLDDYELVHFDES